MTTSFTPDGIRRAGARHAETATSAGQTAQTLAGQVGRLSLPSCLADQQGEINALLARVPGSLQMLSDMATNFDGRTSRAASAYERVEAENQRRGDFHPSAG